MMKKAEIYRVTRYMDKLASALEHNPGQFGLSRAEGHQAALKLDRASDRLERLAQDHDADVLMMDDDEPYMDSYDSVHIEREMDEPYMQMFEDDTDDQLLDHAELTPGNHSGRGEDGNHMVHSSVDYWGESSGSDYWGDSVTASSDYWSDSSGSDYWD